jgi:hypothetical protein
MRHLPSLAILLTLVSGCVLVFGDGGGGGDCLLDQPEPAIAIAPQRNPDTLICEAFGGGCNPDCGPCAEDLPALAPLPSWGFCGSPCEALSETDCLKDAACRVVKDAECLNKTCVTDFVGCFPTDQLVEPDMDCFAARDGFTCSRSNGCTSYHRIFGIRLDQMAPREFAICVPEGQVPGKCNGQVVCQRPAPLCPVGHKAGIANGCYTGACIPTDLCEP